MSLADKIYNEISNTYSTEPGRTYWNDKGTMIKSATIAVMERMATILVEPGHRGEYERGRVPEEIHQVIWIFFPGGTTAAHCTKRICDALGIGEDFNPKDY